MDIRNMMTRCLINNKNSDPKLGLKWSNRTKVAWVRVDTQTILSIHHNVITQNPRISLSYNDHRSWYLHIKNVQEVDRGWYMCQVNTDPMRSRQGYLQVVGKNPVKTQTNLNKRSQTTDAWRVMKVRPPTTEPTWCERAATYSHVKKK
ncbi:hypothetical protein NQ318_019267 [Aromia moschata]|uniref:Ig-like domain-containing protein n=1 Tax=Aromia moschata TaxID=1265417 RepID=A0AAV8Z0H5_9CUCU|nr:hypothetical protein NQ318_019267 [Aromia moschata]